MRGEAAGDTNKMKIINAHKFPRQFSTLAPLCVSSQEANE